MIATDKASRLITIYRDSWRRGGDGENLKVKFGDTMLLNPEFKMMCCLGQCAIQLGSKPNDIANEAEPVYVSERTALMGLLIYYDDDMEDFRSTVLCKKAMAINDDTCISESDRERMLIELFAPSEYTLEFKDGIAPFLVP